MLVILYVKYSGVVMEWMGEDVILAGVSNGVLTYRAIVAYDRCEVCRVLCYCSL